MPLYEYVCRDCGLPFERLSSFAFAAAVGQADATQHHLEQRTASGAGFTPAKRAGGQGGAAQRPPAQR